MLQLRTAQSRAVGIRAAPAKPRQRSRLRAARHLGLRRALHHLAAALGQRDAAWAAASSAFSRPTRACSFCSARAAACRCSGTDRWWTVLSAGWLHGSLLHIIFNMMWVRDLGPVVADMYGPGRMVIIYTRRRRVGIPAELVRVRVPAAPAVSRAAQASRSAHRPRCSGFSARWCTTAVAPAAR